jgi:hypothetical protein
MADKNMKQSGWRVKLKDIGNSLYAIATSIESSPTNTINVVSGQSDISASSTRPNNTTAYAAYDVVGEGTASNLAFTSVCSNNGGGFVVVGANLQLDTNAVPSGMSGFRVHLYNSAPSAITDNSAYNLPSTDTAKYLGNIYMAIPDDLGDTIYSQNDNVNFKSECAASTNTIYGILQTVGAFTPVANVTATVILKVVDV